MITGNNDQGSGGKCILTNKHLNIRLDNFVFKLKLHCKSTECFVFHHIVIFRVFKNVVQYQ